MAAGPADAFSASPRGFGSYSDREFISAAADNLWSSSVVATASTGGVSWVDDVDVGHGPQGLLSHPGESGIGIVGNRHSRIPPPHSSPPSGEGIIPHQHQHSNLAPQKRVEDLRRLFHRGRHLLIKHLPREVTEEEIRELLVEWDVQSVSIQAGSARVILSSPEVLEDWDRNAVFTLRGQRVSIVPSLTEMLLCVARLPLSYSEQQFMALISNYGEIRRCFLMISERTGESKGYGFVEYVTKEAALQAKNALDGRQLLDFTAVCDWLDSSHVTLRSLHSKCLYVDQLPSNYRNMGEFRRIFSGIVNPPYCQIALKNGCPQDWGLVEFIGEDDAERTQQRLDGYSLLGHRIRVAFYIPGVRAINLYLKLLNDGGNNKGKSALLPDPPAPAVFQQLQSLAKQNPVFAQNLQSIILQQIQDVQKGKGTPDQHQQGKRSPFQKGGPSGPFSPSGGQSNNALKNAQQTALTLLLASQQMANGGGGGVGNNGGLSPNSSAAMQNQQLLSALQAVSKGDGQHFLNGGIPMNNGPNNLSSLLGLAVPNGSGGYPMGPLSPLDNDSSNGSSSSSGPNSNIPHGFFPSPGHPGGMHNGHGHNNSHMRDDNKWQTFNKSPRSNSSYNGSNGLHKSPLLPSPSGLSSPILDVPMDTGFNAPKTPPNDPLQAVWYSLFGHSSPPDTGPNTPGNTSPLFMKQSSVSSNSSVGSPIGRSASETMFGMSHQTHKSSPPGFSTPNGNHHSRAGSSGDLQEALNSLLSNPQNLSHLLGNGHNSGSPPSPHQFLQQQQQHQHFNQQQQQQHRGNGAFGDNSGGGMSNAILDLIMQSMKNDQQFHQHQHQQQMHQQQQQQQHHDVFGGNGMKHNGWSSGMNTPPSPIGNSRPYNNGGQNHGMTQQQRSGSNGSSEMSGSSPRSPSYSPFSSRNSQNKSLLESGNLENPTSTPWSNSVLGSPPSSHSGFGGTNFQSRIWAPSVSPGNGSTNGGAASGGGLMNPLGQKRKVHHESLGESGDFLAPMGSNAPPLLPTPSATTNNHQQPNVPCNSMSPSSLASHYADSYFKKKKKN